MPMKISLALGKPEHLSRQTAWGCLTTNLALPGFGSLVAGRRVGYIQAVFCLLGLGMMMIFGTRFVLWHLSNWSRLHDPQRDQFEIIAETWRNARWALLSILVAAFTWLWALITSLSIVAAAKKTESPPIPPRL